MAVDLQHPNEPAGPGPGSERDQRISDAAKSAKRLACQPFSSYSMSFALSSMATYVVR